MTYLIIYIKRQTNRKSYKGSLILDEEFENITKSTGNSDVEIIFLNKHAEMKPFLDIFYQAMEIECRTHDLYEETLKWFRFSEKEITLKKDGLSVPAMGIDGLRRIITERSLKNGDPKTWFSEKSIKPYLNEFKKGVNSSKAVIFLKTLNNNIKDWLNTGRFYERLNLAVTKNGFYLHPYSQVLQEYDEMSNLQEEFNALLEIKADEKIQMAVRIGRNDKPYLSYRRHLNEFLI